MNYAPSDRPADATPFTRRDVLRTALPAAAFAGTALAGGAALFGQASQMGTPRKSDAGMPDEGKGPRESVVESLVQQAFQGGEYALPPLPYAYDALEPHIDEQTMRLHHDKHHQGYVNGLNAALKAVKEITGSGDIDAAKLAGVERNVTFNAGGHLLHTVFWGTMSPDGGGEATGDLADKIKSQYGSFDAFKSYYSAVAGGVKGSGWAVLQYEPVGDNLLVAQVNEHDAHLAVGAAPLLPIDVWEHAYYLKYQNDRKSYISNWFDVVNWPEVDRVYAYTRMLYGRDAGMPAAK